MSKKSARYMASLSKSEFIANGGFNNQQAVCLNSYNGKKSISNVFDPCVYEIASDFFRYGAQVQCVLFTWVRDDENPDLWEFDSRQGTKMTTEELKDLFSRGIFNPEYVNHEDRDFEYELRFLLG